MDIVKPEWSWIACCPKCVTPVDEFDDNVTEDGCGDNSTVVCEECGCEFIVDLR
ncbi:hypothetical protein NVP1291O_63 [Vibrio phage 1.291.O._10N.286.55.F6]|nr:hypothetical protein NVP1291O_63 [Vibrio phage 1.291.O._10N.286.55.F6]